MDLDLWPFLIWLAFIAFSALASRKRRQQQQGARTKPAPGEQRPPETFEEALAQIREALGQPSAPPPHPSPEPQPTPPALPPPPPVAYSGAGGIVSDEELKGFELETAGYQHDRHGFGPENPLSEELFERGEPAMSQGSFDPHGLHRKRGRMPTASTDQQDAPSHAMLDKLRRSRTAQEAIVMGEVLGRPRSARRWSSGGR